MIDGNTRNGVLWQSTNNSQANIINSAITNNTENGITPGNWASNGQLLMSENSVYFGNTLYGIANPTGATALTTRQLLIDNGFGSNGSGNVQSPLTTGVGPQTLSANPFTSSTVFTLNSTAGGGVLLKGAGTPGVGAGGIGTGVSDIGPLPSGGSSAPQSTVYGQ